MLLINIKEVLKSRRLSSRPIYEVLKKPEIHIYLAGPISFAEDLQDYRKSLTEGLCRICSKFKIHDPWLREQTDIREINHTSELAGIEEAKAIAEEVITRDLEEISKCDITLAYFFRIGVGTSMEIFWASRILGKPVIVIYTPTEEGVEGIPLWLYGHANLIFRSKRGLYNWLRKALEEMKEHEEKKTD